MEEDLNLLSLLEQIFVYLNNIGNSQNKEGSSLL